VHYTKKNSGIQGQFCHLRLGDKNDFRLYDIDKRLPHRIQPDWRKYLYARSFAKLL